MKNYSFSQHPLKRVDAITHLYYPLILITQIEKEQKIDKKQLTFNQWVNAENLEQSFKIYQNSCERIIAIIRENKYANFTESYGHNFRLHHPISKNSYEEYYHKYRGYIDFSWLEWSDFQLDFSELEFLHGVNFSFCLFHGDVSFKDCIFSPYNESIDSTHSRSLYLQSFEHILNVPSKNLYSCAEFYGTIFKGNVYFSRAKFTTPNVHYGQVSERILPCREKYEMYKFVKDSLAYPRSYITFAETIFERRAFFNECVFDGVTSFYRANFAMTSNFNRIECRDVMSLNCTFQNNFSLVDIVIGDYLPSVRSLKVEGTFTLGHKICHNIVGEKKHNTNRSIENIWWPKFYDKPQNKCTSILCVVLFLILVTMISNSYLVKCFDFFYQAIIIFTIFIIVIYYKNYQNQKFWKKYDINTEDLPVENYRALEKLAYDHSVLLSISFAKLRARSERRCVESIFSFIDNPKYIFSFKFWERRVFAPFFTWTYCLISDYGRSVIRPLVLLLLVWSVFAYVSFTFEQRTLVLKSAVIDTAENTQELTSYSKHFIFWVQNSPPTAIEFHKDCKQKALFSFHNTDKNYGWYIIGLFLVKTIFLGVTFLVGLALRNSLRLKH